MKLYLPLALVTSLATTSLSQSNPPVCQKLYQTISAYQSMRGGANYVAAYEALLRAGCVNLPPPPTVPFVTPPNVQPALCDKVRDLIPADPNLASLAYAQVFEYLDQHNCGDLPTDLPILPSIPGLPIAKPVLAAPPPAPSLMAGQQTPPQACAALGNSVASCLGGAGSGGYTAFYQSFVASSCSLIAPGTTMKATP